MLAMKAIQKSNIPQKSGLPDYQILDKIIGNGTSGNNLANGQKVAKNDWWLKKTTIVQKN